MPSLAAISETQITIAVLVAVIAFLVLRRGRS